METLAGILGRVGSTTDVLRELVAANRGGRALGITSVCSANEWVLEAAVELAASIETVVLIEATCNQVNQFGGYSGMRPADFRAFVEDVANRRRYPLDGLILGGDHLGPYPWRAEPAEQAMAKARDLVAAYARSGFGKLHLDCSMALGEEGASGEPLDEGIVAARTADLAAVAEAARGDLPESTPAPVYVVGTEVPVPGGERAEQEGPTVTPPDHVRRTWETMAHAFERAGLHGALDRVVAIVVQPGIEFGEARVFDFHASPQTRALSEAVRDLPHLAFEAHSTDYQTTAALQAVVKAHFAFLKVGPALTFAVREALFALAAIEDELLGGAGAQGPPSGGETSELRATVDRVMRARPEHWRGYYTGGERETRLARAFAYSDRIRYYWHDPEVAASVGRLLENLSGRPLPPTLLAQYLPLQAAAIREGDLAPEASPEDLIRHKVRAVLNDYATACGLYD